MRKQVKGANSTYASKSLTIVRLCFSEKLIIFSIQVIYVQAVPVQPQWEPSAIGYLRDDPSIYECPVYTTTLRGPTYIFLATLQTKDKASKWIMSGVALILQTDE